MDATEKNVLRIRNAYQQLTELRVGEVRTIDAEVESYSTDLTARFVKVMDDDFNSANAISLIYELIKQINSYINEEKIGHSEAATLMELLETMLNVLGLEMILQIEEISETATEWVEELIALRDKAKDDRNWTEADRIRDLLKEKGILLEDTANGVRWRKK